jgi:hypothetical protein
MAGWLIFSQSRHVNFSRTVWITFHWRGMISNVSVMSSPIFTIRAGRRRSKALTLLILSATRSASAARSLAISAAASSMAESYHATR